MARTSLNDAQMARIHSMRRNGQTVEPLDDPEYPGWVSVSINGRGFFALIPEDGGKITKCAEYLG